MLSSKWVICGSKRSRSVKEQETNRLLSDSCIRTLPIKIPLLGKMLFNCVDAFNSILIIDRHNDLRVGMTILPR